MTSPKGEKMEPTRVLIVDDDPKISGLLQHFLTLRGYHCETESNGDDAFAHARKTMPDAVVTDIKMPGMDGIALARELKALNPELPVMVMTGYAADYSEEDAIAAGAADFITKPFSLSEFGARFQKLLRDRRQVDELKEMTHVDTLTGIANRKFFAERLKQTIEQAKRYGHLFAVLFLDLDRFKAVNDSCGHETGDLLLKETARRLSAQVRKSDTVAHLGADEFAVMLSRIDDISEAEKVARRLVAVLSHPCEIKGNYYNVTASVGICVYPSGGQDAETLLAGADAAMYDVKKAGGNACRLFSQG